MEVRDQEGNVVSLRDVSSTALTATRGNVRTLMGFLRRMKNDSALWVRNLVNLWTRICSISSACLILMLILIELILGSMKTRSFSLRETVKGFRRTSGDVCASISGTLWRSDACEAKLESESAAVSEERTHWRYGRRDCDYREASASCGHGFGGCGR